MAKMQGPLSSSFPIENRNTQVTMKALKNHLERSKNLPFVKRISDFHLLLVLARVLDLNADVPALTECVQTQTSVPEGYQILIESMASTAWCCMQLFWTHGDTRIMHFTFRSFAATWCILPHSTQGMFRMLVICTLLLYCCGKSRICHFTENELMWFTCFNV